MFSRLAGIVKDNSQYVMFGALLFIGSSLLGYFNSEAIQQAAQDLLGQLEHIAEKIEKQGGGPLSVFWVIFQNNVLASLTMLGLGVFFGLFPIFAMLSNGVLLGFMLKIFATQGLNPIAVLVIGILPHGILELPAVILAASIGIKYGFFVVRMGFNMFTNKRTEIFSEFKESLKDLPFIVAAVIALLFVAAIIESVVTPFLIHLIFGDLSGTSA